MKNSDWIEISDALDKATSLSRPIAPITSAYNDFSIGDAYEIQLEQVRRRLATGAKIKGHKIGLTSQAMQAQLGVDQPDFGHLFDNMFYSEHEAVPVGRFLQPRIEPEIAFVIGVDLCGPGVTMVEAARAVEYIVPALEIIDSRIRDWQITILDTIADNASSGGVVLGGSYRRLEEFDLSLIGCNLSRNGQVVATGAGGAVLGNPLAALVWLANVLGTKGIGIKAGEVILAGSLTASIPVLPGETVMADFSHIGSVSVHFEGKGEGS